MALLLLGLTQSRSSDVSLLHKAAPSSQCGKRQGKLWWSAPCMRLPGSQSPPCQEQVAISIAWNGSVQAGS